MADTLTFGANKKPELLGKPVVHTREKWADAWAETEHLYPEEGVWSTSPTMPAATLLWTYGRLLHPGENAVEFVDKLDWHVGRYVKIEVPCDLDEAASVAEKKPVFLKRYWFGIIEQIVEDQLGTFDYPTTGANNKPTKRIVAGGTQRLVCLGLEHLLSRNRIRTCIFDRGGGATGNDSTIPFNLPGGRGNRGLVEYDGAYVFYYDLDGGAANVTSWNTREIVRYLLRYQSPRDSLNARSIKFRVAADSVDKLPNWDLPYLDQDNATTLSLLQRLVDRRRLLSFWFDVVTDGAEDVVEMHVETIVPNAVQLTIAPTAKIEAAARQLICNYERDPATRGTVRDSELGLYDRVIARGAKAVSIATFSHVDGTLAKAWLPADQTRYEYGAQATAGFSGAKLAEQQRRHAAARSDPRLEDVFARFRIPPTWDQKSGDGFGGVFFDAFPGGGGPIPCYYPSIVLRSSLPLRAKTDYSGDKISTGVAVASEPKGDVELQAVQSYWKRPVADRDGIRRWFRGDDIGRLALLEGVDPEDAQRITIHTQVIPHSHSVLFRVGGSHQHELAAGDFTPAPEDDAAGMWSYKSGAACVTLALENGLHVEGIWPLIKPAGKDVIRTLVIDAGEHYERVYVAPLTVVGISDNGALVRSTGGWIERPAKVITLLEDFAHLAHAWYSIPHEILTIETRRLLSAASIHLGDLVTDVGDPAVAPNPAKRTVNATVTEIRIRWEQSLDADEPPAPSMTINTFAGELDALAVGPAALPGLANPFKSRRALKL
jgi:hypothetical protein